jgi:hypothetical protein
MLRKQSFDEGVGVEFGDVCGFLEVAVLVRRKR